MATLILTPPESGAPSRWADTRSLTDWLVDDWALLFSHPRDFAHESFENHRWMRSVRDAFRRRRLRPLALSAARHEIDASWIGDVTADETELALPPTHLDVGAGMLRELLASLHGRFVVVVDTLLNTQGVLRYVHSYMESLSPLDLLESVDQIRHRALSPGQRPLPGRDYISR